MCFCSRKIKKTVVTGENRGTTSNFDEKIDFSIFIRSLKIRRNKDMLMINYVSLLPAVSEKPNLHG